MFLIKNQELIENEYKTRDEHAGNYATLLWWNGRNFNTSPFTKYFKQYCQIYYDFQSSQI